MQDSGMQVLFQGNNLLRILQGLGVTIGISILSVLLSMIFGTVMGIIMTSHSRVIRFLTRFYLEFIRIMPQLVLLFIVYFGLAETLISISQVRLLLLSFSLFGEQLRWGTWFVEPSLPCLNISLRADRHLA